MRVSRWLNELAILAGAILVLAALGPFGSFDAPFGSRLVHWALYLVTGYVFFRPVIAGGGALARQTGLSRGVAVAAACAFGAFPTTLVIVMGEAGTQWRTVSAGTLVGSYLQILIVGTMVTAVQLLAHAGRSSESGGASDPSAPLASDPLLADAGPPGTTIAAGDGLGTSPAFATLLPPHLGSDIVCLENEDHYVRVFTPHGNALILMRMRDAVAQLEGKGERVHRSWWVARDAVVATVRENRNLKLRLSNGQEVPVARASVATLRARGWLKKMEEGEASEQQEPSR